MASKNTDEYRKLLPEKLPTEDDYSYALFSNYCYLGTDRRLVKVATSIFEKTQPGETSMQKIANKLKHLSTKFRWSERARKYDQNRIISQADRLMEAEQKMDDEWLDKYKQSLVLLQDILADGIKIKEANALLVDAAISKLSENPKMDVLVAIGKLLSGVASTNLNLCKILSEAWGIKENADLIQILQKDILREGTL